MKNFLSLYRFLLFILFVSSSAVSTFAAPGDLDTGFVTGGIVTANFGAQDTGNAVARQPDGKLIVAGQAQAPTGNTFIDYVLIRYNPNGTLDTTFGNGGTVITDFSQRLDAIQAIVIQPDGKIIAGGYSNLVSQSTGFCLARYLPNGTLDTTFGTGGKVTTFLWNNSDQLTKLLLQPDGKIVAAGYSFTAPSGNFGLVRYNADGSLDASFGSGGKVTTDFSARADIAYAAILQADGKIIAGGYNSVSTSDSNFALARYSADGSLDISFGTGGKVTTDFAGRYDEIRSLAVLADGKIVAAGSARDGISNSNDFALARYNADGSLDTSFGSGGKVTTDFPVAGSFGDVAYGVAVQSNGKIIAAGQGANSFSLARYQSNGALDSSFGNGGKVTTVFTDAISQANALLIQPDGNIVATGYFIPNNSPSDYIMATVRYVGDATQPYRAPFDFDGDSKTDISIFRPSGGEWWINRSATNQTVAAQFGASSDKPVPADYTGDGKADIAFYRSSSGQWFILRSEDATFYAFPFGASEDIPAPGDFDADGKTDQAVFRPSQGAWYIKRSSDNGVTIQSFGIAEDKPVVADYDGDGKADIAVFRPSSAQWWILRSTSGLLAVQFGQAGDKAASGDYTGDGKADIAFWRPSNGFWYVLRSEDFSYYGFPFGLSGDIPAPGDFDGDGKTDAAVFRPSNNGWYLNRSTAGFLAVQFGAGGDQPIPSSFVR